MKTTNFIRNIIEHDLTQGRFNQRRWAGSPGNASHHHQGTLDPAKIRTRFPPEPNGYLHLGHAKSICLNFGLAEEFSGACHLRLDDTNPEKETQEYVDNIREMTAWLGFDWGENFYQASNYFDQMYECATALIKSGLAYIDAQTADEIRHNRGTLTEAGENSPYRSRSIEENLSLFSAMKAGHYTDGTLVLRAKIDMASPNINLRDPVLYRIKNATHHHTHDAWCIYPMYIFAHPIEDALENITHSLCTLEFEDQRSFYDWLLTHLRDLGIFSDPLPKQYEFSRLNLSHTVLSKRKLNTLVEHGYVAGWDDPRLPTLAGVRRRGYPPEAIKLFIERLGISKADSCIDYAVLEECVREVLNETALRSIAILTPLELVIRNYSPIETETCYAPNHPQKPDLGKRPILFSQKLWIEREDFMETPLEDYFRLSVGKQVRLRYAYIITCTGFDKDEQGNICRIYADYHPETKSGTEGANSIKVKGNIHWLSQENSVSADVRLYDGLFLQAELDDDYLALLNPNSLIAIQAKVEKSLPLLVAQNSAEKYFQFERQGYFVWDEIDKVFNRTVTLKDGGFKKK